MDIEMLCEAKQEASVNESDQQQLIVVDAPVEEQKPDVFKLDVDCFEEVFNWLSLKDLHAFGRTCKRMQQVAGFHFRLKYPGAYIMCRRGGIYCNGVQINQFSDYIHYVEFCQADLGCFFFMKSNSFKSLKKMYFERVAFTDEKIACLKKILSKVEIIEMNECDITGDFYARFLQYCTNMKQLNVRYMDSNVEFECDWLLQNYPKLERLVLNLWDDDRRIDELTTFFKRNSSVQHFAMSEKLLWTNRHLIIESNVKLDTLAIWFETPENDEFRDLMIEFREREVFKRLHLCIDGDSEELTDQIDPMSCIERVECLNPSMHLTSVPFVNLKELHLFTFPQDSDLEAIAGALVNLELCHAFSAHQYLISAFIRRSQKLKHFLIEILSGFGGNILDLAVWNKEREKLAEARKVTIYIKEEVFLATKNATNNCDYRMIGIERFDSYWMDSDFPNF